MAFTASTVWDLQASGSDSNGGGFDTGVAGFPTDGAATLATSAAPVFTSASYSFVAGDVGAWIFIKSGTNWIAGWYSIASVSVGAATLNGTIGAATLTTGDRSTLAGCAATASPTGATWGIDYSKGTSAQISFTDMVIGGTTTTFTSAGNPVGKNFVGNIINITSGTGFTVQRVAIVSTSGTTATCDKSLGTTASTGGNGAMGGALATVAKVLSLRVSGNLIWVGPGTYTNAASITITSGNFGMWGWSSIRGDRTTTRPSIASPSSGTMFVMQISSTMSFRGLAFSRSGAVGNCMVTNSGGPTLCFDNCTFTGTFNVLVNGGGDSVRASNCSFTNLSGSVFASVSKLDCDNCYFDGNSNDVSSCVNVDLTNCIFSNQATAPAIFSAGSGTIKNCSFYNIDSSSNGNVHGGSLGLGELLVQNCILWGIGAGAHAALIASAAGGMVSRGNAIGNFSATPYSLVTPGSGDIVLTVNPFTNPGSGDFSLNTTTGGGALCRGAGFPNPFIGAASTAPHPDLGAVQSASRGPVGFGSS